MKLKLIALLICLSSMAYGKINESIKRYTCDQCKKEEFIVSYATDACQNMVFIIDNVMSRSEEFNFCSVECARKFLETDKRYTMERKKIEY